MRKVKNIFTVLYFILSFTLITSPHALGKKKTKSGKQAKSEKNGIEICHFPPGNNLALHTIRVDTNALDSHLSHGDKKGACKISKKKLNKLRVNAQKILPHNPNNINFESNNAEEVYDALRNIAKYELGRHSSIQQVLLDWSAFDFSSPPLFEVYDLYEKAVVTMPERKIYKVVIQDKPHRFIRSNDMLLERNLDFSLLTKIINKKLQHEKLSESGSPTYKITIGLYRLAKGLSNSKKSKLKDALNEEIKNPAKTFWPNEQESALSVVTFVELINVLKWQELSDFLRDVKRGKYDERILNLFSGKTYLKEIKSIAKKTVENFS